MGHDIILSHVGLLSAKRSILRPPVGLVASSPTNERLVPTAGERRPHCRLDHNSVVNQFNVISDHEDIYTLF